VVTVVGSANVDLISYGRRLPLPGETVMGHDFKMTTGGKGANQAAACARLGIDTIFLGKLSNTDPLTRICREGLSWAGVDVSHIWYATDTHTGVAVIMVGEKSYNLITIVPGANGYFIVEDVEKNIDVISSSALLITECGIPLESVEFALLSAKKAGVKTLLTPSPACTLNQAVYGAVDIIVPNETETGLLTGVEMDGKGSLEKAAQNFHEKGVESVVITLGERGSFVSHRGKQEFIDAISVDTVDTTGAGDAYVGGLAKSLVNGADIFNASRFAAVVAALSVAREGTMRAMPTQEEVDAFIQNRCLQIHIP
jgi:ribokinase